MINLSFAIFCVPRALTQQLQLMGEQIMLARKRRHLSMQDIADRATMARLTVSKVEHGDPFFVISFKEIGRKVIDSQ